MDVSPALKYTLARLGLLVAVLALLLPIPNMTLVLKLLIAVAVSALLSFVLLRRMRDQLAEQVGHAMDRRREQKEKLRSALAGESVAGEGSAEAQSAQAQDAEPAREPKLRDATGERQPN